MFQHFLDKKISNFFLLFFNIQKVGGNTTPAGQRAPVPPRKKAAVAQPPARNGTANAGQCDLMSSRAADVGRCVVQQALA
jgi:hypothetical protein